MAKTIAKPIHDEESMPFWTGLIETELRIQFCNECNQHIFYPRSVCPQCFSDDITWKKSCGSGSIYSYTVVHTAFGPYKEEVPFVVAIIELDEGVRMLSRIVGERDQVKIGKRVAVTFERIDDELVLPYFELE